jgi:hypothetical protein
VLTNLNAAQRALDLGSFNLAAGSYTLYAQAYAKATMRNQMSGPVAYNIGAVVQILSPGSGTQVSTSFRLVASATTVAPVKTMRVYLDNALVVTRSGTNYLDASVSAPSGKRKLRVEALDNLGATVSSSIILQVKKGGTRTTSGTGGTGGTATTRTTLKVERSTRGPR